MDNVSKVLQATLHALGESSDPRKESLLVYAIKLEIRRVLVHLESAATPSLAVGKLQELDVKKESDQIGL